MEISIISCVFPPEPVISAQTSAQVAEALLKQNHIVHVITAFPNRPEAKLYPGYNRKVYAKSILSGRHSIVRCFSTFSHNSSIPSRFLENISFGITSGLVLLFSKRPDVIYANTWPIFAVGIVRLIASLRRIPLVISIQDVYPESLMTQSRLKEDGLFYKFLMGIDRWIIKGCHTIIPISERFANIYQDTRAVSPDQIKVIPNWVENKDIIPGSKMDYRKEKSISDGAFVLVYGGNIGKAAGVETVITAMGQLNTDQEILFLLAGSGTSLESCIQAAQRIPSAQILFHSPWPVDETSLVLGASDVLVLPTQGNQSLVSVPSKMITYMLSSRPILALALPESETAHIILESGCGWVINPDQPDSLARKIEVISKISEDQLVQMGLSGRKYALQNFVSEICLPKVVDAILSAANP